MRVKKKRRGVGAFGALYETHIVAARTPNSYGVIRDKLRMSSPVHAVQRGQLGDAARAQILLVPPAQHKRRGDDSSVGQRCGCTMLQLLLSGCTMLKLTSVGDVIITLRP